ncbi:MAG: hypothetical protein ACLQOO_01935 [Terriglobia bacterium]
MAELIGAHSPCHPERSEGSLFTSCATESSNTAIDAALKSDSGANPGKRHIVTSSVRAFLGA